MRFFLLVKIFRQQNTVSSEQIYAGLRAPQTPRARLAAWTASQNYVLLFQPVAFIQAWPANIITVFLLYRALYLPAVSIFISGASRTITSRQLSSFLQSKSQPFAFFFYFLSIFCSLFFLLFLFHSLPTLSSSNIPNFYFFRIFLRISAQKNSIHYWML